MKDVDISINLPILLNESIILSNGTLKFRFTQSFKGVIASGQQNKCYPQRCQIVTVTNLTFVIMDK